MALAVLGVPAPTQLLEWFIAFLRWLPGAMEQGTAFTSVAQLLAGVASDLWGILSQLWASCSRSPC